jgi:hypothetical protein
VTTSKESRHRSAAEPPLATILVGRFASSGAMAGSEDDIPDEPPGMC